MGEVSISLPAPENDKQAEDVASKDRPGNLPSAERNLWYFIMGIMWYKVGFESLTTCIALLALHRFHPSYAFTMMSVLMSGFAIVQASSAMTTAQLLQLYRTSHLLAYAMWAMAVLVGLLLSLEVLTGGTFDRPGSWSPFIVFAIYLSMGACLGVLELLRRTVPADIMGVGDVQRLKSADAKIHIFYEVAGSAGAFMSVPLILHFGYVYALLGLPLFFFFSGICYINLDLPKALTETSRPEAHEPGTPTLERSATSTISNGGYRAYLRSLKMGASIIFSQRKFTWLLLGYTLPAILHRLLENVIFPAFSKTILHHVHLNGLLLGSSNIGELLGAMAVLMVGSHVRSPLPFVRCGSLTLLMSWAFVRSHAADPRDVAISIIPLLVMISGGWSASDVSVTAYIQAELGQDYGDSVDGISPLASVLSFLYSAYILCYTLVAIGTGRLLDYHSNAGAVERSFFWLSGVGMSIGALAILASTFFAPKSLPQCVEGGAASDGKVVLDGSHSSRTLSEEEEEDGLPLEGAEASERSMRMRRRAPPSPKYYHDNCWVSGRDCMGPTGMEAATYRLWLEPM